MIIETAYRLHDTITIKTTGGDEIVARFVEENDKTITVTKPLALMATQQGIGLGPFCFTVDPAGKLSLNKSAVLFVAKTESSMAKQYISSTSGLTMV
jgi:hypothetical protein|tara:strand:+ start:93 stop:383 length:291 start_codon:yes stop_codon:yes gene_type:complete